MRRMMEKITTLEKAAELVKSGSSIAIGGFTVYRKPMAFVRELLRTDVRDLKVLGWTSGIDVDMLAGAGRLRRVELSYVGLDFLGLAPSYRRAVESGELKVIEYTELTSALRFKVGAMGMAFFPAKSLFGSDVLKHNPDVREIKCPFTGEVFHAVPAARPDVTVLHAPMADVYGNVVYLPSSNRNIEWDIPMAECSRKVVVTVEKIVEYDYVLSNPLLTKIPRFKVDAVVEVPYGAHPTDHDSYYKMDKDHLRVYAEASRKPETFKQYLDEYVYGVKDHWGYMEKVGGIKRMVELRPAEE
jgi:glutaconate CoA-transferase subunit A